MKRKHLLFLFTALIVSWAAQAQSLADYRFETGVDSSKWITLDSNATVIWNTYRDAAASSVYNLGFTFPLVEEVYSQFSVSSNGIFRLGPDAAARDGAAGQFTASSHNLSLPKICGVSRSMGTGENGYVKFQLTGSAPNRVFVCEFCLSPFSGSGRTADMMWQVQLHEDSSRVVIVYGSNTPITTPTNFQTGLAADFDDIMVIDPTTHTAIHSTVPYSTTYYTWHGASRYYSFTRMPIPCAKPVSASLESLEPTSATISWVDTTHAASWMVRLDTNGAIYTSVDVLDTSVTFTGLIPDWNYLFHVANVCDADNVSAWRRMGFRTPCTYLDRFPYFEDFERYGYSTSDIACWHTGITTLEGSPVTSNVITARADLGDDTVGLSLFGSLSLSSRYYCWAAMPRVDDSVDVADLEVSFLIKRPNTAEYLSQLVVGVASDPAIPGDYHFDSTFVPIDTIDVSDEPITSIHAFSVTFENYTGNGKYIVFQALAPPPNAPTPTHNSLLLDNVMLQLAAGCPTPQRVRVTRTTADSVFATWNPVAGADTMWVYVGTPGFRIEDVTPQLVIGNTCAIGNLIPNTEYELVVAASCGGSVGYGSYPASFRTLCTPITSLPFVESFEDVTGYIYPSANGYIYPSAPDNNLPSCWRHYYRGNDWRYLGYPIVYGDPLFAHSGNNSLSLISSNLCQIAVMPLTDSVLFPVSGLHVSFWMRSHEQYAPIVVGVMSDPADTNTFVPVDTCQVTGLYSHYEVGFVSYMGPHGHIAFRPLPPNVWSRNPYLYIDDITIDELPPCVPIETIHAQTTQSAALLTWDYNHGLGNPTGYAIHYRLASDTTGTSTIDTTTTLPEVLLTGLDLDTTYWVSVEALCDSAHGTACTSFFNTLALPCLELDTVVIPGDTLVLGNPGTGTNANFPVSAMTPSSRVQHLFLASEIPVSGPTTLKGIGFDYAYNVLAGFASNCTVYLAHTTLDSMTNSFVGGEQMVYTGSLAFSTPGWNYVQFNQGLFAYDGVSNLVVTIDKNFDHVATTDFTFRHETTATQMTSWGGRPRPVGTYTMSSARITMRSNTRLITCGDYVYCNHWANCIPPIVRVDTLGYGEYRLSWIPGYGEYSWDVDYRAVDSINWTHATRFITNTSYTFSMTDLNLELDTKYEFRVLANCNDCDDTLYTSVFINTPCGYMHIPFIFGFEGLPTGSYSNPSHIQCWHHLNDGSPSFNGDPSVGNNSHTGNRCLGFSLTVAQYNYGSYQAMVLPRVDVSAYPINTLYMSLWALGAANNDNIPILYVGVMTDPTDINTFQYVDSIVVALTLSDWQLYEFNLENYNGVGEYIALRANRPELGHIAIAIDDIRIDDVPICRRVDNIKARNVTTNSATITWTRGGRETSWELTVGDSVYHTTDTFYTVNTLDSNTFYDVTVRAICGEGDTSTSWSTYFQTPCYYINTLPYFNDFENEPYHNPRITSYYDAFPACWRRFNSTPSTNGNFYPYIARSSTGTIHGHNVMYWDFGRDNDYVRHQHAILPPVDTNIFNMSDLTLAFYAKVRSRSDTNTRFVVGVMENSTDSSTFVPVDTVRLTIMDTMYVVSFSNYTGTGSYIALRGLLPRNSSDALLDDVFLTDEWCEPPSHVRAFTSDTSVTIYWNGNGNSRFTVALGTDTVRGVTDTFYTFTGLTDSTMYTYSVAAECSRRRSMFVNGHIQTECHPLTYRDLPYFEDFEGYGHGRDSAISPCWRKGMSALSGLFGTPLYPFPANCFVNADTGGLAFGASHNPPNRYSSWASLPRLDDAVDVSRLEVNFLIVRPSALGRPIPSTRVVVGVSTDQAMPEDSATMATYTAFVPIDTIDLSDQMVNSIHPATVRFDNYTGNGKYIVFLAPPPPLGSPSMTSNSFTLDNVLLRLAAPCPTPQHVRVTRTTFDSVYATWDSIRNANTYLVYIGTPGFDIESATPHYVHSNSCAIGNLNPDTDYELVIVASCGGDVGYSSYPVQFHTMCAPLVNLPFVEDFEGVVGSTTEGYSGNILPPCWLHCNLGSEYPVCNYPIVFWDASTAYRGNNAMRFITYNTNVVGDVAEQIAVMPITDATLYPASGLQVSFWISNLTNYYVTYMVVGVMSDPSDTSTFVPMDTVTSYPNIAGHYERHKVKLLNYTGPHGHVAFKAPLPPATGQNNKPCIDNVTLDVMCQRVTDLHVTYTSTDSITIVWSGTGNNYEVAIKPFADTIWPDSNISVSDTTYTFTGLQPGTPYQFRVRQDCTADTLGYSIWTEGIHSTRNRPCLPPDSLTVSDITNASATFDWIPIGYETAWQLHVWFSGGIDSIYTVSSHPTTVGGLAASVTYRAAVRSLCGSDNSVVGDWGDTIIFTTDVCPDVTGLTASVNGNSVTLDWDADPLAVSWTIEYGFHGFDLGTGTTINTSLNTYTINGLIDEMEYDFHVRAVCGDNWMSEGWANVSATTQTGGVPCEAPTNVSAVVAGNAATISWTANTGNISYELEYGPRGYGIGTGTSVSATSSPTTLSNLDYETDYDVYVHALCDQNTLSAWSTVVSFTTEPQGSQDCDPVTDLTASNVTEHSALLSWTPGSTGDEWEVMLTTAAGTTVSEASTTEHQFALNGLTPSTTYVAKVRTICGDNIYSTFASTSFTTASVGIDSIAEPVCIIHPNPTSGNTTVTVGGVSGRVTIAVVDLRGREVATATLDCASNCAKSFDVDRLTQGAYFVRITGENVSMVKKLIVR